MYRRAERRVASPVATRRLSLSGSRCDNRPVAATSPAPDDPPRCSAKGCRAPASWDLVWNNPRVHTPDREKVWLACDDHRDSLGEYLRVRGFLRRIDPR